jgi:succinate dehydrogenase/fumarate reductase flavoprotein subunit
VCGEASGGVHGAVRVTGCSTVECTVFGRIAGEQAAAMKAI